MASAEHVRGTLSRDVEFSLHSPVRVSGKIDRLRREKGPKAVAVARAPGERNGMTGDNDTKKRQAEARAARLEAQLRANLKKRKERARARARGADAQPEAANDAAQEDADG
jgi:hypothetical protein